MSWFLQLITAACKPPEPSCNAHRVWTISTVKIRETTYADTLRWGIPDLKIRILPFFTIYLAAVLHSPHKDLLGFNLLHLPHQLMLGLASGVIFFVGAAALQLGLTRRRGGLAVPKTASDAAFEGLYYVLNGPAEECFFRGFLQSTLSFFISPCAAFAVATSLFVTYHRLGWKSWPDVLSTAFLGIPLGLAYWHLPGPPLIAISLAHIGGTCGFMGPGPYLLNRLGLLDHPGPALQS